jgi:pimeloyl-ACP methyl ester carboxylesterase
MREAGRITGESLLVARDLIRPGISTLELDTAIRQHIEKQGAKPSFLGLYGFPGSACISINDEVIHGIPTERRMLCEGDIVKIDVGACYRGYNGDSARSFPVGRVSDEALRLIETTIALPCVDKAHVHITGTSMGGYGTWEVCLLRPHWFASAMPLCSGGICAFANQLVDLPIRAFHGLCDNVVDPIESLKMVRAVNLAGGYAELILLPHVKHACWATAYSDEKNFDWLLSFTNERNKAQ